MTGSTVFISAANPTGTALLAPGTHQTIAEDAPNTGAAEVGSRRAPDDWMRRDLGSVNLDRVWTGDITYIKTTQG